MMLSSSYNFSNDFNVESLVRESFERIGLKGEELTPFHYESAQRSANLELSAWQGRVGLDWLRKRFFITLPSGGNFFVNKNILSISTLLLSHLKKVSPVIGTLISGKILSGSLDNCLNGGDGACVFDKSEDVKIAIALPELTLLSWLGIKTTDAFSGQLSLSLTNSALAGTGESQTVSQPDFKTVANQYQWVDLALNAKVLNLELSFMNLTQNLSLSQIFISIADPNQRDISLGQMSYNDWQLYPNKQQFGRPTGYVFYKGMNPQLIIWPLMADYTEPKNSDLEIVGLLGLGQFYANDIGAFFNNFEVPQRYFDALAACLSYRLALKFNPDRLEVCHQEKEIAYDLALHTSENFLPVRIKPDLSRYF